MSGTAGLTLSGTGGGLSEQLVDGHASTRHGQLCLNLTRDDVEVHLTVKHHDPDIDAILNDPGSSLQILAEANRVERWQRK